MPDTQEQTEVSESTPVETKKSIIPANSAQLLTKVAMFGLISLVAIFAAYILTVKVLRPMMTHTVSPQEQATQEEAKPAAAESNSHNGEEDGSSDKSSEFFTIESIIVNPAGTAGTRYLSCSVSFELPTKDDKKSFEDNSVKIKAILITILSSKTVEELADVKKRNAMRREILTVVNRFVAPAKADAVYLTDFVLQ
jgi:flagellar FliL protein